MQQNMIISNVERGVTYLILYGKESVTSPNSIRLAAFPLTSSENLRRTNLDAQKRDRQCTNMGLGGRQLQQQQHGFRSSQDYAMYGNFPNIFIRLDEGGVGDGE